MAVPKKRMSKSRSRMRRSHDALATPNLSPCPQCGDPKESHRVCPSCGHYRGKQIFEVAAEEKL
jgi:large subunit ribosomal protein L32